MNRYVKAEFELVKKQKGNLIGGGCLLFVFALFLLFSGVGNSQYCAAVAIIGYATYLFICVAFVFSPASYWQNRKKIVVTTEHMVLLLGESKRNHVKNKLFFLLILYFGMLALMAVMQLPAALIAGAKYSLWSYGLEVLIFTFVIFLSFIVFFAVPANGLFLAIMGWCGFCGGFVGGYFSVFAELTKAECVDRFWVMAVVGVAIGVISIAYCYIRTVIEERGGLFKRTDSREDEKR